MCGFFVFFLMLYRSISVLEGEKGKEVRLRKESFLNVIKTFCFFLLKQIDCHFLNFVFTFMVSFLWLMKQ